MHVKNIQDTNFQDYKKTSMLIGTCYCGGKCWRERGLAVSDCQNEEMLAEPTIDISDEELIERYLNNPISHAIIFGGLEPFEQFYEVYDFIDKLRNVYNCEDDVVIYTGYNREEEEAKIGLLQHFPNIVIKWGRYSPGPMNPPAYDEVMGITLATSNQYGERIS